MKELRITFKVRNNRLIERREAEGLTAREVAEAIGISYASYIKLESLKDPPYSTRGLRPAARKVAVYFGVAPEELWPDGVLAVKQAKAERRFDAEEAMQLLAATAEPPLLPDHYAEQNERLELVRKALALDDNERRRRVIELRLEGLSLRAVGDELGISLEYVRQSERKAWRLIRERLVRWGCDYAKERHCASCKKILRPKEEGICEECEWAAEQEESRRKWGW
jgi:RNA polymerase sigma factor (sigma-70 family)